MSDRPDVDETIPTPTLERPVCPLCEKPIEIGSVVFEAINVLTKTAAWAHIACHPEGAQKYLDRQWGHRY